MDRGAPLELLDAYGLRVTRPRALVGMLLFNDGRDKHVTAEWIAEHLELAAERVALATVYNTLHNFADAGLLRKIHGAERGVIIFDTNTAPHHHFYNEATKQLSDIPAASVEILGLPQPPKGTTQIGWEVIVRVR